MNDDHLDNFIKRKVRELDNSYPDNLAHEDKLWQQVLLRKQKKIRRTRLQWRVAASLLVLIIAGIAWRMSPTQEKQRLTDIGMVSTKEHQALEYIKKLCYGNSISCDSPAFKELQNELKQSSLSLMEIDKQIQLFGTDANLLRAKARIENHQANVIRAMVQTL